MGAQKCAKEFQTDNPKKEKRLKDQLKRFQELPDDALTERGIASIILGCSMSSVQRMERSGILEPAVKIGPNMVRLRVGNIRKLMKVGA
jgi:hypothetical protein